jgi:pimeloyl-ACP methyl ester carboxylesterase
LEDVTSTANRQINLEIPQNQQDTTQTIIQLQYAGTGPKFEEKVVGEPHKVTRSFNISSTLCVPKKGADSSKALQVLTHGVGLDHSYWDFLPGYSYVDVAAKHGASTFSYDRLGVAKSSTPEGDDPLQVIQGPMEVVILDTLIKLLKAGHVGDKKYQKIISTGHSYGSVLTVGLTHSYPDAVDAAILTGMTTNSTGLPFFIAGLNAEIANRNNPLRFGHLNNGYLVSQNAISAQTAFLHYPGTPAGALETLELNKQTVTMGVLLTLGLILQPAPKFTGPVFVANGINDIPFCLGDCEYPTDLSAAVPKVLYPNSNVTGTKNYAKAGHGLNVQTAAPEVFEDIQQFIKKSGL